MSWPQKLSMPVISRRYEASSTIVKCGRGPIEGACRLAACGLALLLVFIFAAQVSAAAKAQAPEQLQVKNYVSDFANVLSAGERDQLNALAAEVDRKADAQIAVVTVKTLDGKPIEDYSIDLATRLGVGPKASNRGVLILLAVDDHQYRIEVGYGLEGILPDGKVGGFGREAVPYLRQDNYDAALQLMTRRVADVIAADRGVTLAGTSPPAPLQQSRGTNLSGGEVFLLFACIFIVFSILRRAGSGGSRLNRYGGRYGGGGWWIGPMMGGGWGSGGFGGGGGGGSGGFGGFGGGSFGGGGASGSW
jgi:uncharacterized protein